MKDKKRKRDEIPEKFITEEQAGEFWDSHSITDYEEYLEQADVTIDIQRRHYEIEVDKDCFLALIGYAKKTGEPVKSVANRILKDKLISA